MTSWNQIDDEQYALKRSNIYKEAKTKIIIQEDLKIIDIVLPIHNGDIRYGHQDKANLARTFSEVWQKTWMA